MFSTAELNVQLFSELEPIVLRQISTVSKDFNIFANDNVVWRSAFYKLTGVNLPAPVNAKMLYHDLHMLAVFYRTQWNVDNIVNHFQRILAKPSDILLLPCDQSAYLNDDDIRQARSEYMPFLIEAACLFGLSEITTFLIGHNHHVVDPVNPLFFALYNEHQDIIKMLINAGVSVHASVHSRLQPQGIQMSPLHFAFLRCKPAAVKTLFEAGALFTDLTQIRLYIESEFGVTDLTLQYPFCEFLAYIPLEFEDVFSHYPVTRTVRLSKHSIRHLDLAKTHMYAKIKDYCADHSTSRLSILPVKEENKEPDYVARPT